MTDVSKTLADLKARFADNTREAVTPQDMRDLLESIANPVAVGGLRQAPLVGVFYAALAGAERVLLPANPSGYNVTPLPIGTANPDRLTYGINKDPGGWAAAGAGYTILGSDPDNSWGVTYELGYSLMMEPGVYSYSLFISTESPMVWVPDTSYVSLSLDQAEYDSAGYPWPLDLNPGPYYYDRYYNPFNSVKQPSTLDRLTVSTTSLQDVGMVINDSGVPKPFIAPIFTYHQASQNYVTYFDLRITRLV